VKKSYNHYNKFKGFFLSDFSKYSVTLDGSDIQKKRQEIKEYFNNTFDFYEKVFLF